MVLGSGYPLLPPTALQLLVLGYQAPDMCFLDESGFTKSLIAIWSPEALSKLKKNVKNGSNRLNDAIQRIQDQMIRPLRQDWITRTNSMQIWEEVMKVVVSKGGY